MPEVESLRRPRVSPDVIHQTLIQMTPRELAEVPRWVQLWREAGNMTEDEAAEWMTRWEGVSRFRGMETKTPTRA